MLKKAIAGAVLAAALLLTLYGALKGEPQIIWSNGRILCLTCIGIK
ncbi:hypothetical protein [Thermovibrio ammonificans]|uniref:Uncharacterized protein n=1 Tax=Thermovibrio ammonificans (strain DSM 15698 / JCM 12110 / HB-1) TaxID=648996 RepID=E8T2Y8_THEA1|nr:hypothetical protein [Thermovibrio ammonificans]ADU97197.1 hypothetical protein Theam_1233 [Thermovibrio ammonificans HB-1]